MDLAFRAPLTRGRHPRPPCFRGSPRHTPEANRRAQPGAQRDCHDRRRRRPRPRAAGGRGDRAGKRVGPLHGAIHAQGCLRHGGYADHRWLPLTTFRATTARLRLAPRRWRYPRREDYVADARGFSTNNRFGRTNNPGRRPHARRIERRAAAAASGNDAVHVGTDLSGSIRIPAHFCGVFGFKPTEHRVVGRRCL